MNKNFSLSCLHCQQHPCVDACLAGALSYERNSQMVLHDESRCVGCWMCVLVCPYGAIRPNLKTKISISWDKCKEEDEPAWLKSTSTGEVILQESQEHRFSLRAGLKRSRKAGLRNFVIIGNSAAGIAAAEAIRNKDPEAKITIISEEDYNSYYRCLISYFLAADIPEEKLAFRADDFYKENNLDLILNKKVTKVEPRKNRILLEDRTSIGYDKLLIATGASPKFPDQLKGTRKRGVFGLRTIKDAKEILGLLPVSSTSCVLGDELISLKAAYALLKRKQEIKIIVESGFILSQVLDEKAAGFFMKRFKEAGVEIMTGSDIIEILGNGDLKAIRLASGKVIACSILVIGKGVSPNIDLIKEAHINTDKGIIVDKYMRTNIPNIFAAGDVAQSYDLVHKNSALNPCWLNAVKQGRTAGSNMAGENLEYEGSIAMNSMEFFNLPAVSMGITRPMSPEFEEIEYCDEERNIYKKFVLKDRRLVGMIAVRDIRNCGVFLRLIKENKDISSIKSELTDPSFNYTRVLDLFRQK